MRVMFLALLLMLKVQVGWAESNWTEKVSLYGDLRLRQELIQEEDKDDRHRSRLRVRLGAKVQFEEKLKGVIRFSTAQGQDTIVSTNQTMTDAAARKAIGLDLAYVDYQANEKTQVLAGKMSTPFWTAGKNELIFDGDWTPEGLAVKNYFSLTEKMNLGAHAGVMWLEERTASDAFTDTDALFYAAQITLNTKTEGYNSTVGVSSYSFAGLKGNPLIGLEDKSFGNSTVDVDLNGDSTDEATYKYEYMPLVVGFEMESTDLLPLPTTLYGEWVQNSDPEDKGEAFLGGIRFGKLKEAQSWVLDYSYREVQKDATLGAIADGDTFGGGTNGRGHKAQIAYQISSSTTTSLTQFISKKSMDNGPKDYSRTQFDFVFTF